MHPNSTIEDMKEIVENLRRNQVYTLTEITGFMPWARNKRTVRGILEADRKGLNMLHCQITGAGSQRRYLVEGKYLISYLKVYGPVLMETARKPKQIYGRRKNNKGSSSGETKAQ